MFRGGITVRRYDRSSCLICQSEGWLSAFSFAAKENINKTSVICSPARNSRSESGRRRRRAQRINLKNGARSPLVFDSAYSATADLFIEKCQLIRWPEEANKTSSRFAGEGGGDVYAGVTKPLPGHKDSVPLQSLKRLRCGPHRDARACTLCSKVDYKSSWYVVGRFNPVV